MSSTCNARLLARLSLVAFVPTMSLLAPAHGTWAQTGPTVSTQSAVFVERLQPDASRRLEPADRFNRGDRIITVVNWRRAGGLPFVITSPVPAAVAYQASAWDAQQVSVDGGRTWGKLEALHIGSRSATPEDVTHIRWRISSAQRSRGQIAYSGIIR